jgi:aspartate aminotransferase
MCGARIGCIVSKNKVMAAMKFAQARLSPSIEQIASEAALDTPSYFDEVISEYREQEIL